MPDLLTHSLVTLLVGRATSLAPLPLGWFLSGAIMPDFVARAPTILLGKLVGPVLSPGDYGLVSFAFSSLHTPIGFALVAAACVLALPERLVAPLSRRSAWSYLMAGALLHIAVDTLQMQYSLPPMLLFPFSLWGLDIGFLGSEDSIYGWPVLIPLAAFVEWRRRQAPRAAPSSGPPSASS